jgi:DNA replication and repair protein RecF
VELERLAVRGFRNLADATFDLPPEGVILLGANGQGKTSLLEAIGYPVLFRSFRSAQDSELVRFDGTGFAVEVEFAGRGGRHQVASTFRLAGRRRQHAVDGTAVDRLADGAGTWLAVTFQPEDVRLAGGPAAGRRLYLDRTLGLADRGYWRALSRYRAALKQRNSALRQRRPDLAAMFDPPLAEAGSRVVAGRLAWLSAWRERFAAEMVALGEGAAESGLGYHGHAELADPAAWPAALAGARSRDEVRGMTTVGPHRDDLDLRLGSQPLREFGSTGQQRTAAIALKLLELATIEGATGESPALLLDDVFAELDSDRRDRLTDRLFGGRRAQVFLTSPRRDELPAELSLAVWRVDRGRVLRAEG